MFARALRETVADRNRLAEQMHRMSTEMETRVEQLTVQRVEELTARRVEQFTQQERRRIASDLHDDLGAKLLTIVHTSDSARIPQLAREALDEMRLSVRGLAGRPVRLDEALADWRAEVMTRLQQAAVEARWENPDEALEQTPFGARLHAGDTDPARSDQQRHQAQLGDGLRGALPRRRARRWR